MDTKHRFHTDETWLWVRAEHGAVIAICAGLLALHLQEVAWWRFAAAFVAIDLVGYIPGALAFKRAGGGRIGAQYHHLYNLTHSYLVAGLWVGLWAVAQGSFEWAMLAVPIHLAGDRGLFGNTYKPIGLPFEPVAHKQPAPAWPVVSGEVSK
jgi:hypothetical protein